MLPRAGDRTRAGLDAETLEDLGGRQPQKTSAPRRDAQGSAPSAARHARPPRLARTHPHPRRTGWCRAHAQRRPRGSESGPRKRRRRRGWARARRAARRRRRRVTRHPGPPRGPPQADGRGWGGDRERDQYRRGRQQRERPRPRALLRTGCAGPPWYTVAVAILMVAASIITSIVWLQRRDLATRRCARSPRHRRTFHLRATSATSSRARWSTTDHPAMGTPYSGRQRGHLRPPHRARTQRAAPGFRPGPTPAPTGPSARWCSSTA